MLEAFKLLYLYIFSEVQVHAIVTLIKFLLVQSLH